ncbi:hypothetical protein, partial [Mycobacterium tuberculosis]|uniref:hypothetical protein n=1 Tax=Mycobacterium tuberculosis TaxID=1773 RepID=UPI000A5574D5
LSDCEWLTAEAVDDIVAEAERVRQDEAAVARLQMWVRHYFGDTTPGVATQKFHGAVEGLMQEWERWRDREIGAVRGDEDDDDDEADDEDS